MLLKSLKLWSNTSYKILKLWTRAIYKIIDRLLSIVLDSITYFPSKCSVVISLITLKRLMRGFKALHGTTYVPSLVISVPTKPLPQYSPSLESKLSSMLLVLPKIYLYYTSLHLHPRSSHFWWIKKKKSVCKLLLLITFLKITFLITFSQNLVQLSVPSGCSFHCR